MEELIKAVYDMKHGAMSMMKKLLIVIFVFLICISSGWVKIVCDGNEIANDIKRSMAAIKGQANNSHSNILKSDYELAVRYTPEKMYKLIRHEIKPGETLYSLQRAYGTGWQVIKSYNAITNIHALQPGQVILVPIPVDDEKRVMPPLVPDKRGL